MHACNAVAACPDSMGSARHASTMVCKAWSQLWLHPLQHLGLDVNPATHLSYDRCSTQLSRDMMNKAAAKCYPQQCHGHVQQTSIHDRGVSKDTSTILLCIWRGVGSYQHRQFSGRGQPEQLISCKNAHMLDPYRQCVLRGLQYRQRHNYTNTLLLAKNDEVGVAGAGLRAGRHSRPQRQCCSKS